MRVAILGCGYVGLAAGRRLLEGDHHVIGLRRSAAGVQAIEDAGMEAIQADLRSTRDRRRLPDADWVFYTASAGRQDDQQAVDIYVDALSDTIEAYTSRENPPSRVVYTSSTGVYGDHEGRWVDEQTDPDPIGDRGRLLLEAERTLKRTTAGTSVDWTVMRFGGLYGPDRYRLERFLTKPVTEGYRNLLHREDAAGVLAHLVSTGNGRNDTILCVDDEPIDAWAFVDWLATACQTTPPPKQTIKERLSQDDVSSTLESRLRSNKRCQNEYLRSLGYEFAVPTYREGYRPAIDAYLAQRS